MAPSVSGPLITVTRDHSYLALARVLGTEWRAYLYRNGTHIRHLATITAPNDEILRDNSVHLITPSETTPVLWIGSTDPSVKKFYNWTIGSAIAEYDYTADADFTGVTMSGGVLVRPGGFGPSDPTVSLVVNHLSEARVELFVGLISSSFHGGKGEVVNVGAGPGVGVSYPGSWQGRNLIPAGGGWWIQGRHSGGSTNHLAPLLAADGFSAWGDVQPNPVLLNESWASDNELVAGRMPGVRLASGLGGAALVQVPAGEWYIGLWPEFDATIHDPPTGTVTEVQHTPMAWDSIIDITEVYSSSLHASPDGSALVWLIRHLDDGLPYFLRTYPADGVLSGPPSPVRVENAPSPGDLLEEDGVEIEVLLPLD